ncbi:efflux RND transporter periplasmic adaptor subunit [Salinisphaera orenii]|uniref:efflux RND transporter periplasmic adaptor subunit n=1 Tax=Salinisphaera orenii TaxID=856731 RepID=UPI000DBEA2D9
MPRLTLPLTTFAVLLATVLITSGCDASRSAEKSSTNTSENGASNQSDTSTAEAGHDSDKHHEKSRTVHLSAEQRDKLSIRLTKAPGGSAEDTIKAPAEVHFDADKVARVGPRLDSKVVEVKADLGDRVKAGDTLAVLDSVALGKAKADYMTAAAHYQNAQAVYRRKRGLADDKIISQAAVDEARAKYRSAKASRRAARAELSLYGLTDKQIEAVDRGGDNAPLSRFALTAPIAGTVQARDVVVGQSVAASETPFQIVDAEQMWVMLQVSEQNAASMATGLPVSLGVRSMPERRFTGETDWVSEELDAESRTLTVRATVPNADGALSAGMFGTATVQTASTADYALVPTDAVQTLGREQSVVFVPGSKSGQFRAVAVTTGDEGNGEVEIRQGIQPGDSVVTAGAFDLMSALTSGARSASH